MYREVRDSRTASFLSVTEVKLSQEFRLGLVRQDARDVVRHRAWEAWRVPCGADHPLRDGVVALLGVSEVVDELLLALDNHHIHHLMTVNV